MSDIYFNKLLEPVSDIITSIESVLSGAFGITTGDQRESYKRIYTNCWGIHTLVMDVIMSLGIEEVATRPDVHDRFHSLMRPIQSSLQDLSTGYDGTLNEEQGFIMDFITSAIQSVEHMMENLWYYSSLKHQKIHYNLTSVEFTELMKQFKTVSDELTVPTLILPCRVVGDKTYLSYAFREIAYNIKQHAHVNEISLEAQLYANRIDITVYDRGEGFDCDNMMKPFQPFWQADNNSEGFGLGLYLAKAFIEQSRGTISISSQHQKGTLVKVSLPLAT